MKKRKVIIEIEYSIPEAGRPLDAMAVERRMAETIAYALNQDFERYYRTTRLFSEQEVRF
jgi:hypothetical protein